MPKGVVMSFLFTSWVLTCHMAVLVLGVCTPAVAVTAVYS